MKVVVKAGLKDIKVTAKGVNVAFENVKLDGESLQDLSEAIGGQVLMTVETEQVDIFEMLGEEEGGEIFNEDEGETVEALLGELEAE